MTINKLTRTNFLPSTALGATPVYADKLNTVVTKLNAISASSGAGIFDTIAELTSGSGVTIDSVLLKDGTIKLSVQTLAATGTNQATAAAITGDFVKVTGADGTTGVVLPAVSTGKTIIVRNTDNASALKVYPNTGGKINLGTDNVNIVVPANTTVLFTDDMEATDQWMSGAIGSTLLADNINELTSASGVTIDGTVLKDGTLKSADGTASVPAYHGTTTEGAGIYFGSNIIYFATAGVERGNIDAQGDLNLKADLDTTLNIGTKGTGVTGEEHGHSTHHTSVLTLTSVTVGAIAAAAAESVGALIYTFPAGAVIVKSAYMSVGLTQTGSLIGADTPDVGIGTTVGSGANATLNLVAAAAENILTGQTAANVTGTATVKTIADQILVIEAAGDHTVYLNIADTWAGADAGVIANGTVVLEWMFMA